MNWRMLALCLLLSGCAAVQPDGVFVETHHLSSIAQHLETPDTNRGLNSIDLRANWTRGPWQLDLSEGYSVHGFTGCGDWFNCNARDVAEVRVSYEVWHK